MYQEKIQALVTAVATTNPRAPKHEVLSMVEVEVTAAFDDHGKSTDDVVACLESFKALDALLGEPFAGNTKLASCYSKGPTTDAGEFWKTWWPALTRVRQQLWKQYCPETVAA